MAVVVEEAAAGVDGLHIHAAEVAAVDTVVVAVGEGEEGIGGGGGEPERRRHYLTVDTAAVVDAGVDLDASSVAGVRRYSH